MQIPGNIGIKNLFVNCCSLFFPAPEKNNRKPLTFFWDASSGKDKAGGNTTRIGQIINQSMFIIFPPYSISRAKKRFKDRIDSGD